MVVIAYEFFIMKEELMEEKKERGCLFILMIVISCFILAGLFFFAAGRLFGEDYRHLVFFGIMGIAIAVFLGREIFRKNE